MFREGRKDTEDEKRSGRLSTSHSGQNMKTLGYMLNFNQRLRVRMLASVICLKVLCIALLPMILEVSNTWRLHHDSPPSHTAFFVTEYLEKHCLATLSQPPYSPDLKSRTSFCFQGSRRNLRKNTARFWKSSKKLRRGVWRRSPSMPSGVREGKAYEKCIRKKTFPASRKNAGAGFPTQGKSYFEDLLDVSTFIFNTFFSWNCSPFIC